MKFFKIHTRSQYCSRLPLECNHGGGWVDHYYPLAESKRHNSKMSKRSQSFWKFQQFGQQLVKTSSKRTAINNNKARAAGPEIRVGWCREARSPSRSVEAWALGAGASDPEDQRPWRGRPGGQRLQGRGPVGSWILGGPCKRWAH